MVKHIGIVAFSAEAQEKLFKYRHSEIMIE